MKVCLIHPRSEFLIDDAVMPPLGLWYLAASIRKLRHEVIICDLALGDSIPKDANVYGITGTSPQAEGMRSLIEQVFCTVPKARIIAGGPHASLNPGEVLSYGCHAVVVGEGEEVIGEVLDGVTGVVASPRIVDLDSLPFPDRTHARRYKYAIDGRPATTMMTSRGCPHGCAFCCKTIGRKLCSRSVENILAEVKYLKDEVGFDALMFFDDTLGLREGHLTDLCEGMASTGVIWRCFMRGGEITEFLAKILSVSGCVEVGVGVESGSDRILSNIQKGETVSEIERGVRLLRHEGVRVKGFFIVGLPGENDQSLSETEKFLERVPLDDVDFCIFSVLQGSPIYLSPNGYDVMWNGLTHYKGAPKDYECRVWTSALSSDELLLARRHLEDRFKRWR